MAKKKKGKKSKKLKRRLINKRHEHLRNVYRSGGEPDTGLKKNVEKEKEKEKNVKTLEPSSYIKKDLKKTFIITTILFLVLIIIFATQNHWQQYINR